jgi:hypothetical protein
MKKFKQIKMGRDYPIIDAEKKKEVIVLFDNAGEKSIFGIATGRHLYGGQAIGHMSLRDWNDIINYFKDKHKINSEDVYYNIKFGKIMSTYKNSFFGIYTELLYDIHFWFHPCVDTKYNFICKNMIMILSGEVLKEQGVENTNGK